MIFFTASAPFPIFTPFVWRLFEPERASLRITIPSQQNITAELCQWHPPDITYLKNNEDAYMSESLIRMCLMYSVAYLLFVERLVKWKNKSYRQSRQF